MQTVKQRNNELPSRKINCRQPSSYSHNKSYFKIFGKLKTLHTWIYFQTFQWRNSLEIIICKSNQVSKCPMFSLVVPQINNQRVINLSVVHFINEHWRDGSKNAFPSITQIYSPLFSNSYDQLEFLNLSLIQECKCDKNSTLPKLCSCWGSTRSALRGWPNY